jgi:hypothetical protein
MLLFKKEFGTDVSLIFGLTRVRGAIFFLPAFAAFTH